MADYLKIPEVADRLDVSEKTARTYVKTGRIPSVFIGGAYRVSETDLEEYLRGARVRPEDQTPKAQAPSFPEPVEYSEEERREIRRRLPAFDSAAKTALLKLAQAFEAHPDAPFDTAEGRVGAKRFEAAWEALDAGSPSSALELGAPELIDFVLTADRDELVALLTDADGRPDLPAVVKFDEWMIERIARGLITPAKGRQQVTSVHEGLAL